MVVPSVKSETDSSAVIAQCGPFAGGPDPHSGPQGLPRDPPAHQGRPHISLCSVCSEGCYAHGDLELSSEQGR